MNKLLTLALGIGIIIPATAGSAEAQQNTSVINPKARQKASWFNAPREIQIIDERPVVRDFREAPQVPSPIQLPPGPGAHPGAYGGGAGALGDDGGATIPAGGMPIGGPSAERGFRTPDEINPNSVPLEKTGFNRMPSNIPSGGIGPKGPLPAGFTTGVAGRVAAPKYPNGLGANPAIAHHNAPLSASGPKQTPVYQYNAGQGYSPGVGTSTGNGGAETSVKGKLMNRLLNQVK